jgi:hypothetical protein
MNILEKLGGSCRFEISVHFHVLLSPQNIKCTLFQKPFERLPYIGDGG